MSDAWVADSLKSTSGVHTSLGVRIRVETCESRKLLPKSAMWIEPSRIIRYKAEIHISKLARQAY